MIPALKKETPELYESTKDSAICYLDFAKEYLASFTVAQLALNLTEQTLFAATEAIKYAGLENKDVVKPVVENFEAIRRNARAIRRAGAKEAEPVPAKTIGEVSLVGAVAEILGANYFLSYVGLKVVPVHLLKNETTETLETSYEEETVEEMLSDEKLATYVSDEDPEYEPCEHKAEAEESPDHSEEVKETTNEEEKDIEKSKEEEEEEKELEVAPGTGESGACSLEATCESPTDCDLNSDRGSEEGGVSTDEGIVGSDEDDKEEKSDNLEKAKKSTEAEKSEEDDKEE